MFIARESGRPLAETDLPDELAISVITIGELRAGVLAAVDVETRDRRLATLSEALALDPLPVDQSVAETWARFARPVARHAKAHAGQRLLDRRDGHVARDTGRNPGRGLRRSARAQDRPSLNYHGMFHDDAFRVGGGLSHTPLRALAPQASLLGLWRTGANLYAL